MSHAHRVAFFATLLLCFLSIANGKSYLHNEKDLLVNLIRTINVPHPGFVEFIPNSNLSQVQPNNLKYHLAVSSFNGAPFSADFLFYYKNLTKSLLLNKTANLERETLYNKNLVWPNEVNYATSSLFYDNSIDPYGGLFSAGGFLVPSKNNGKILYYKFLNEDRSNVTLDVPIDLTTDPSSNQQWFYHRVKQVDINGDSLLDLLTCRTYKPIFGTTKVELVSFVFNPKTNHYDEYVLMDGVCDVFFDVADLDNDGRVEIIAAGFFISKLNFIYSNNPNNNFLDKDNIVVKTIDETAGKVFDIQIVDLDLATDKFPELLVTNHQGLKDEVKSSLFYYKTSGSNVRDLKFERHLIYDDFPVLKTGFQQAAPGSAKTFLPYKNPSIPFQRPYIFVSGDGSENAYIFAPNADISQPLSYNLEWSQIFYDTVGGASFADLDLDGWAEFALAVYEKNTVLVFSFKP
jgi:hypothetical protein